MKTFISYSRADLRQVQAIARELRTAGVETWVDTEDIRPGDHWDQAITNAIRTSDAFVACVSPLAAESMWTSRELDAALAANLPIFPVMIEPTPIESLPDALRQRHIVSLFRHPPAVAPRRVARQIATALGLPCNEVSGPEDAEHIDVLILRIGHQDEHLLSNLYIDDRPGPPRMIVETTIDSPDPGVLKRVMECFGRSRLVYVAIGQGARSDDCALLCGLACAIVGADRLNLVAGPDLSEAMRRMSGLTACHFVDPVVGWRESD